MSSCSGCINETEEMKCIGLHNCNIGLATKTRLLASYPVDEKVEELKQCNEYRTATIEEAIRYLSDGNNDIERSLKTISEQPDINCHGLRDPYNFEGCWKPSDQAFEICSNFDKCEAIFKNNQVWMEA